MVTLTKKINGTNKSKLKSRTPIIIAISKKDSDMLKAGPREAIKRIIDGKGLPTDWYTLMFRTEAYRILGEKFYTEQTAQELKEVRDVCLALKDRYIQERNWILTDEERELLIAGLDAADQMQDDNLRRHQLDAYNESNRYTTKIAQSIEDELDRLSRKEPQTV